MDAGWLSIGVGFSILWPPSDFRTCSKNDGNLGGERQGRTPFLKFFPPFLGIQKTNSDEIIIVWNI